MTVPARCHAGRCTRMGQTGPGLCGSCARLSGSWLADLPSLVHAVAVPPDVPCCDAHARTAVTAGLVRGTDGEPVSGSRVPPIPVPVDVLSLLGPAAVDYTRLDPGDGRSGPMQDGYEPLGATLLRLCEWVAVGRSATFPRRTVVSLLRFLSIHHDWTCRQSWADDYAGDLYRLWVDCRRLSGTFDGRPEPMVGVPCPFPDCNRMALVRIPGEDGRTCDRRDGGCGRWLSEEEYERWTRLEAYWVKATG